MKEKKAFQLYTVEEKLKIVQDHLNNHISIRACAAKYHIASTSLVMWLRTYREKGIEGLESQIGKKEGKGKDVQKAPISQEQQLKNYKKKTLS